MNPVIRPAREGDHLLIRPLQAQIARVHADGRPDLFRDAPRYYDEAAFSDKLSNPDSYIWLAESEGKVVGYAFAMHIRYRNHPTYRDFDRFYIDDICVDETCRRQGIGSQLFERCLEQARELCCRDVELGVFAFNKEAIAFYRGMGMHERTLRMELPLTDPRIRHVMPEDMDTVLALIHEGFSTAAAEQGLTRENCPGHTSFMTMEGLKWRYEHSLESWAFFEDGRMVGYVCMTDEGEYAELRNLTVLPTYRHRGIGEALVTHLKGRAHALGKRGLVLGMIDRDERLKSWYAAQGFVVTGTQEYAHLPFLVCNMKWEDN
ncbi:MAG: GNAT family N-acetyltransferase [Clostridia bacterium]|nr:GNAT family N-acetyltransferase [Clostridia bacterium]